MRLTQSLRKTPTPILLAKFLRLQASRTLRDLERFFGARRARPFSLAELSVPDSELARKATTLVGELEPLMLVNHSIRTYLFGAAIGRHFGMRVDSELLYLGAILHDIGLVAPYDLEGPFEVNGARAARSFLHGHGLSDERADIVHEAIALHTSIGAAAARCAEISLVQFGAGVDVVGLRFADIAPETRAAIVAAYPRHDFKRQFSHAIESQALRKPDCHIAGHVAAGFTRRIHSAPFSE
jgi:cyanamide hydratase family protein with HD domain